MRGRAGMDSDLWAMPGIRIRWLLQLFLIISASAISFFSSQAVREFVFKTEETIGDRRIVNIRETIEAAKNNGFFGLGYGISQQPGNERVRGHYGQYGKL